jgi:Mor family transcriptional regulator
LPDVGHLPSSILDFIDMVGVDPGMALARAYSGTIVRVPTGTRKDGRMRTRLIEIMGAAAAEKFIDNYRNERVSIPRCAQARRNKRNRRIIAAYDGGQSVPMLALEYGLTTRQIYTILNRPHDARR